MNLALVPPTAAAGVFCSQCSFVGAFSMEGHSKQSENGQQH